MIRHSETQRILAILPFRISFEINDRFSNAMIEEIHLRRDRKVFLKTESGVKMLSCICSSDDLDAVLAALTDNSLYAHSDSIEHGYIIFGGNIRIGVCGRAVAENNRILTVESIESLNIRIPHIIRGISAPIISALNYYSFRGGVLIYSLPGVGKTTLLRDIALCLSSFPYYKRVSLIDPRCEIGSGGEIASTLDVFSGYPLSCGIEMAIRTMSPEVIVCDEIGGSEEENALISMSGKGVCLIASAHGENAGELLKNNSIKRLHTLGLFKCYVGIRRKGGKLSFTFTESNEVTAEK